MRFSLAALLLSVGIFSQGCAEGATAPDVAAVDKRLKLAAAQDEPVDCAAIFAEISGNNQKIADFAREQYTKLTQRTYWAGKDSREATSKDIQALQSRQQYLAALARHRTCGAAARKPF